MPMTPPLFVMAMPGYAGKYGSKTKPIGTETMEAETYGSKPIDS
jgi:hypothetical protein